MAPSSESSSSSSEASSPPLQKRKRNETATNLSADSSDDSDDDAPVLSHAERRRQKKREKKPHKEGSATKKRKLQDGTTAPESSSKRQNSVWVGNLSFKTTPEDLRTFFEGVGEITRIHMPTKAPVGPGRRGENRGCVSFTRVHFWCPGNEQVIHRFAYVDFSKPDAKAAAIAKSEQPLIGRKLLIKDGVSARFSLPRQDMIHL